MAQILKTRPWVAFVAVSLVRVRSRMSFLNQVKQQVGEDERRNTTYVEEIRILFSYPKRTSRPTTTKILLRLCLYVSGKIRLAIEGYLERLPICKQNYTENDNGSGVVTGRKVSKHQLMSNASGRNC